MAEPGEYSGDRRTGYDARPCVECGKETVITETVGPGRPTDSMVVPRCEQCDETKPENLL